MMYIYCESESKKVARPLLSEALRQSMYDAWKANSELSTDRRTGRQCITIDGSKSNSYINDLEDANIALTEDRIKRMVAQKYIYYKYVENVYDEFVKAYVSRVL